MARLFITELFASIIWKTTVTQTALQLDDIQTISSELVTMANPFERQIQEYNKNMDAVWRVAECSIISYCFVDQIITQTLHLINF